MWLGTYDTEDSFESAAYVSLKATNHLVHREILSIAPSFILVLDGSYLDEAQTDICCIDHMLLDNPPDPVAYHTVAWRYCNFVQLEIESHAEQHRLKDLFQYCEYADFLRYSLPRFSNLNGNEDNLTDTCSLIIHMARDKSRRQDDVIFTSGVDEPEARWTLHDAIDFLLVKGANGERATVTESKGILGDRPDDMTLLGFWPNNRYVVETIGDRVMIMEPVFPIPLTDEVFLG